MVSLHFNMLSRFVIVILPRSNHLLISWLQWYWSPTKTTTTKKKPKQTKKQKQTNKKKLCKNSSRKNDKAGPNWNWHSVVHVSEGESKIWCCKEQCCIGNWNVRCVNQGKLDVVKPEKARVSISLLGIRELKWMGMEEFNSDDHYICYCGQESLIGNGVALIVTKKFKMQYLDAIWKTSE